MSNSVDARSSVEALYNDVGRIGAVGRAMSIGGGVVGLILAVPLPLYLAFNNKDAGAPEACVQKGPVMERTERSSGRPDWLGLACAGVFGTVCAGFATQAAAQKVRKQIRARFPGPGIS